MGQGVVWYTGQFYALFFLQSILKVDGYTANLLIAWSLVFGTGFFIVFGALSDKIGRKPIILAGCLIAALTFFPIFRMITTNANPALEKAIESTKVEVVADPAGCGDLFNPVGTRVFTAAVRHRPRLPAPNRSRQVFDHVRARRLRREGDREWQGSTLHRREDWQPGRRRGGRRGGLSQSGRSRHREDVEPVRHLPSAGCGDDRTAVHPGDLCHHGVRADRGDAGRTVPDQDPLHLDVAALPHRQWLVRRLVARDRVRDRGRRPAISMRAFGIRSSSRPSPRSSASSSCRKPRTSTSRRTSLRAGGDSRRARLA